MSESISKEKAKYLKRMEAHAKHSEERSARRKNQIAAQKAQVEWIAETYKKMEQEGPKKFNYSDEDLRHIENVKRTHMMRHTTLAQRAAFAASQMVAEQAVPVSDARIAEIALAGEDQPVLERGAEETQPAPTEVSG